jgi:mannose-1-phosphate guanylyltransferase / phosphomannomutase
MPTPSESEQVVIAAGGRGTRLGEHARSIPKPMVEIGGNPNLEHQLLLAKAHGFTKALLLVSHLAESIMGYFGDGQRFGMDISYGVEQPPLGTAGALRCAAASLDERFLLLYGDVFIDCDLTKILREHARYNPIATLVVHPNDHPYDSDLVETDVAGWITAMHAKTRPADLWLPNNVNSGVAVLERAILSVIPPDQHLDLASQIFPMLTPLRMRGYRSSEYFKDFGTPDRLAHVRADYLSGKIASLHNPRPTVFLDRDGVINKEVSHLSDPDQFELVPGAGDAIRRLNRAGHMVIVITNQPVIARGECTVETLRVIHHKLETLLGREHAWIDAIYYCPHHPDRGFVGEVAELKIDCECRKPKTGLYERAIQDWSISMTASWAVGDSQRDIIAAQKMGLKTIGVRTGHGCRDCEGLVYLVDDISAAVEVILR